MLRKEPQPAVVYSKSMLTVSGDSETRTHTSLGHLLLRQARLPFHHVPIYPVLFYIDRPLANYSITSFCFDRSEAQYEEKPNHGFRVLDSQLLTRFIFLLAYAGIFFRFTTPAYYRYEATSVATRVRKHTLRNLPNAITLPQIVRSSSPLHL